MVTKILLVLRSHYHPAEDFYQLRLFSSLVRKKYYYLFGRCFTIKENGFQTCKFCFPEKHTDLHQFVTFCINYYLQLTNPNIISVNDCSF